MKDFDIAKYLREHQLGSYGILNHYVDLKPLKEDQGGKGKPEISEMGVEDDYMYDPYADEYNSNAQPGTNSVYNAASKKADELEAQAKKDPNNRQLRLAADKAREEALKYAQMFRESVSEADSMTSDNGWQYDDDDFYGGDSGAEDSDNKLYLKKMVGAVQGIIEDLDEDGYRPEEIKEIFISVLEYALRPYMK